MGLGNKAQHIYDFSGEITTSNTDSEPNLHRYLQRSIEIDVISNKNNIAFVYIKLPNTLLIGYIALIDSGNWRQTRICVNNGSSYICAEKRHSLFSI